MLQRLLACVAVVGCGTSAKPIETVALGDPPIEVVEATHTYRDAFVYVEADTVLGTVRSLRGFMGWASGSTDAELLAAAKQFVRARPELFGSDEFVFDGSVIDPELWTFVLAQQHQGVPVVGGHLSFVISKGTLVLVQGQTYPHIDLDTRPAIDLASATAASRIAIAIAPQTGDRDHGRLVIVPVRTPGAVSYRLAWEVTSWRGEQQVIAYVDAHEGGVLSAYDANRYDFRGKATHEVDQRTVGDALVTLPAGYMRLHSTHGIATTDREGAFTFKRQTVKKCVPSGACTDVIADAGALVVTANLRGTFVDVKNLAGEDAAFVGVMRPDRDYALEWDEARATPEELDVFRGVNDTNRFVSTVFPDNKWMAQPLLAKVNHNQTCNAYWNGTSINFFREGGGCNNTGRIFDVVAHEWGHGLDQNSPGQALDGALGEFIGDMLSFVQTESPHLGPGFFKTGEPVRDLEDPEYECYDPRKREVHAAGHLLGAVIWDVYKDLKAAGVTGERLKRLMVRPVAIAQTRAQWYAAMLAVDDDDGNLWNGTPNECLIYNQYKAHSCGGHRWPGIPAEDPPHCRN